MSIQLCRIHPGKFDVAPPATHVVTWTGTREKWLSSSREACAECAKRESATGYTEVIVTVGPFVQPPDVETFDNSARGFPEWTEPHPLPAGAPVRVDHFPSPRETLDIAADVLGDWKKLYAPPQASGDLDAILRDDLARVTRSLSASTTLIERQNKYAQDLRATIAVLDLRVAELEKANDILGRDLAVARTRISAESRSERPATPNPHICECGHHRGVHVLAADGRWGHCDALGGSSTSCPCLAFRVPEDRPTPAMDDPGPPCWCGHGRREHVPRANGTRGTCFAVARYHNAPEYCTCQGYAATATATATPERTS